MKIQTKKSYDFELQYNNKKQAHARFSEISLKIKELIKKTEKKQ